jgi:HAD superfamily hydrolase (TIGR01459 family)
MTSPSVPILDGVRHLGPRYAAWLCDVWGVVHNGVRANRPAVEALRRYRQGGGAVLLLTNAPRPAGPVVDQLGRLGVAGDAYDAVITSGDATRHWLAGLGKRPVFVLGPERDLGLVAGLGLELVGEDEAEVVLCTGLDDDTHETPADYEGRLAAFARRGATMMCANPDIVVDRGGTLVFCAGALAERYAAIGGAVVHAGKPHQPIYDLAFARLAEIAGRAVRTDEVLAVGDGLATDIAGGAGQGADTLFVIGGIHLAEVSDAKGGIDPARLARLLEEAGAAPVAAVAELAW